MTTTTPSSELAPAFNHKGPMVSELPTKGDVEGIYLVKLSALQKAKDGKSYLALVLMDQSGELDARVWNQVEQYAQLVKKGTYLKVTGKLNLFQGKKQLILSDLSSANLVELGLTEDLFVVKAKRPPQEMYQALLSLVSNLDDYYLKELLQNILNDQEIKSRLLLWPAGKTIHHAYQSGLLEHILSVVEISFFLAPRYDTNINYVVAGAILHDLAKIYELSDELLPEYTDEGKLIGHLIKGLEIVDRFSYRIKNFPQDLKMHLKHILLSHHGEYAFGSPKLPQTPEAMLVHLIDYADSKMNAFMTAIKAESTNAPWTQLIKHLDRTVYRNHLPYYPEAKAATSPSTEKPAKNHPEPPPAKKEVAPPVKQSPPSATMGDILGQFKL